MKKRALAIILAMLMAATNVMAVTAAEVDSDTVVAVEEEGPQTIEELEANEEEEPEETAPASVDAVEDETVNEEDEDLGQSVPLPVEEDVDDTVSVEEEEPAEESDPAPDEDDAVIIEGTAPSKDVQEEPAITDDETSAVEVPEETVETDEEALPTEGKTPEADEDALSPEEGTADTDEDSIPSAEETVSGEETESEAAENPVERDEIGTADPEEQISEEPVAAKEETASSAPETDAEDSIPTKTVKNEARQTKEESDPEEILRGTSDMIASGDCSVNGDGSVTWRLTGTDTDMTLTISGSGAMAGFTETTIPWAAKRDNIKNVIFEDGVTSVGDYACCSLNNMTSIEFADSVTSIGSYSFAQCVSLIQFSIPSGVTSIGSYAFSGCSGLNSITIPESVTSIGEGAFEDCDCEVNITVISEDDSGLFDVMSLGDNYYYQHVIIPEGVTSIGDYAFMSCSNLTSITIPDSVTSIGDEAFRDCSFLESITIPSSVTSIGNSAFFHCNLQNIYINDISFWMGLESGEGLKDGSYSLYLNGELVTDVTIPDSVTSIGDYAFKGCSSLKSITIPDSVTSIGNYAFMSCSSLTSITIPDSVTSIGYWAFDGCSSLKSITIPDSVTSIGSNAFYGCNNLHNIYITDIEYWMDLGGGGGLKGKSYSLYLNGKPITDLTIPSSVTSIGASAFRGCSCLTSITIPSGVTSIGTSAFRDCINLTGITIPSSVTSIGDFAFWNCINLTGITIPDSEMIIGNSAFNNCSSLESITIPSSVTHIGDNAFQGCNFQNIYINDISFWMDLGYAGSLKSGSYSLYLNGELVTDVTIPDSVTSIGDYAFWGCSSLESITIPSSVTSIEDSAFSNCRSLKTIIIPSSVTSIGRYAFFDCSVDSITIPSSVTSIGDSAFSSCRSLTTITIPDSVTSIGNSVFSSCSNLKTITIPDSVTSIGERAFSDCSSLEEATLPVVPDASYSYDGQFFGCFYGCSKLKTVTILDGADRIGSYAFEDCSSLESITIPSSVTSIGEEAFSGCSSLESIFFLGSEAQWNSIEKYYYEYNGTVYFITTPVSSVKLNRTTATTFTTATVPLTATISPSNATMKDVTWTSSNEKVATVDQSGVVTAKAAGTTVITVSSFEGGKTASCTVTVKKTTVSGIKNRTYTGSGRSQSPTVTVTGGGTTTTLVQGEDFTLRYENNVEVGTATVKIVALPDSEYVGKITKTFQIVHGKPVLKSAVNAAGGIKVTWGAVTGATKYRVYRKTATGNFAKLADTTAVTYLDKTAKAGIKYFYTVRCLSADGTKTTSSYDTEGKMGVYVPQPTMSSLTSPKAGQILPKWGRFSGVDGYQIQYSQSSTFASGNKTATAAGATTASKTISSLESGMTYYVRVRTYKKLDGKNYYSAWSAVKSVKVK